jgi:ABC-2 type transport system ATP-binding protein
MSWGTDRVSVVFGETTALAGVTIDLRPGRIAMVVGGDGAGKTTLCRAVVGLDEVADGVVSRPSRTGFQPETSGVWADLTVLENLQFVAGGYQLPPEHSRVRIDELLEVTGLAPAADRLGRQLSGGMRQKLGVAMAVLSEPDLLVLDEPTTGLDPVSRLELWSFINRSAQEGRALLISTAYVDEAQRGDVVVALEEGRVLASGSIESIVDSMPGRLFTAPDSRGPSSWHRGHEWRVWSPNGADVPGGSPAKPDLADVITVAALSTEAP